MIWTEENQKQIYEGHFYVNRIHGYGRMTYANGFIFEVIINNPNIAPGVNLGYLPNVSNMPIFDLLLSAGLYGELTFCFLDTYKRP